MILMKMQKIAEIFLGCDVKNVGLIVPSYFNISHRRATKYATIVVDISVMKIINEPTITTIAYGFHTNVYSSNKNKTILVFNLGGCTFNISILKWSWW